MSSRSRCLRLAAGAGAAVRRSARAPLVRPRYPASSNQSNGHEPLARARTAVDVVVRRSISTSAARSSSTLPVADPPALAKPRIGGERPSHRPAPAAIDFSDSASAHGSKTTVEILRAIAVFEACRLPLVVKNAESLLDLSSKIIGTTATSALVRHTFFKHFCAGENSEDMRPVIDMLHQNNIGPILDYAAESEGGEDCAASKGEGIFTRPPFNQPARVYDYKSELECDKHVEIFRSCIQSVRDVSPAGFAALKTTALGNPELLERMSTMITEVKTLFGKFDKNRSGLISREEFVRCYKRYFHLEGSKLADILDSLDPDGSGDGTVDYISFAEILTPYTLPAFTLRCRGVGPLALATPSDDEITLMGRIGERLHSLAEEADRCGVKLLVDAEHTKFQPAIDNLVLELQRKYNSRDRPRPVIFNTYQCYLKDTPERIETDLGRSERFGFHFAAKLVRGAYMVHERERAQRMNQPSPVFDSAEATHRCYDDSVERLLRHRSLRGPGVNIMIATHNQQSVERAVSLMSDLGLDPAEGSVHFAQLYGMRDNLTFTLGNAGYGAFKYLPYGAIDEVVPYLVRRAQENGDVLGNAAQELGSLRDELGRRRRGVGVLGMYSGRRMDGVPPERPDYL